MFTTRHFDELIRKTNNKRIASMTSSSSLVEDGDRELGDGFGFSKLGDFFTSRTLMVIWINWFITASHHNWIIIERFRLEFLVDGVLARDSIRELKHMVRHCGKFVMKVAAAVTNVQECFTIRRKLRDLCSLFGVSKYETNATLSECVISCVLIMNDGDKSRERPGLM